jgi:hypothetical protein
MAILVRYLDYTDRYDKMHGMVVVKQAPEKSREACVLAQLHKTPFRSAYADYKHDAEEDE